MKKRVRIVNTSGVGSKTELYDFETGEKIGGARRVGKIVINPITLNELVTAEIEFVVPAIDIVALAEIKGLEDE